MEWGLVEWDKCVVTNGMGLVDVIFWNGVLVEWDKCVVTNGMGLVDVIFWNGVLVD
jgi:hypothetical protein